MCFLGEGSVGATGVTTDTVTQVTQVTQVTHGVIRFAGSGLRTTLIGTERCRSSYLGFVSDFDPETGQSGQTGHSGPL